jgi:hypothetical protein
MLNLPKVENLIDWNMFKIIAILFFLSANVFAQETEVQLGEIIAPDNSEQAKMYKKVSKIVSNYGVWLPYRVNVLGSIKDQIIVHISLRYGKEEDALLTFNKDLSLKNIFLLDELVDAVMYHFRKAIIFGGKVNLFFTTRDKSDTKEYAAMFRSEFEPESETFSKPELIMEIPKQGSDHNYAFPVSENGKYLAVVANIGSSASGVYYNFLVLDESMKTLYKERGAKHRLSSRNRYYDSEISNSGNLYLFFDKELKLKVYDRGDEYLDLIAYSIDGTMEKHHLEYDDFDIADHEILQIDGKDFLFVSWFHGFNWDQTGFYVIDLEEGNNIIEHEFDPEWSEPILKRGNMSTVVRDKVQNPILRAAMVGVHHLSLLDHSKIDEDLVFVLVKNTAVMTGGGPGISDIGVSTSSYQRGDILILKFSKDGHVKEKDKIDRVLVLSDPQHEIVVPNEEGLTIFYPNVYSKDRDANKIVDSQVGNNMFLLRVEVKLDSLEISEPEVVEIKDDDGDAYKIWMKNAWKSKYEIFVLGAAKKKKERLVRISL